MKKSELKALIRETIQELRRYEPGDPYHKPDSEDQKARNLGSQLNTLWINVSDILNDQGPESEQLLTYYAKYHPEPARRLATCLAQFLGAPK